MGKGSKDMLRSAKVFQFLNHIDEHTNKVKTLMVEKFKIVKTSALTMPRNLSWITIE